MNYSIECDVVVVGAGAAGLICAIEAGKRGRSVVVLERNDDIGKKIRISGGGRCNFTNLYTTPDNFITENPNFHKSALARYTPADFIALVERHRIAYHEKKLGQLFCDGSSLEIIAMLRNECAAAKVRIFLNCPIDAIKKDEQFAVSSSIGDFRCESVVIASGGLSIPTIGATGFGYAIARQFGLRVTPLRAALVPLLLDGAESEPLRDLQGVSLDAAVTCGAAEFRESILFTHRGLSGPAILQISSYWKPGDAISLDISDSHLPRRFAKAWNELYAPPKPVAQWSRKESEAFEKLRREWTLLPSGTEGYKKAEVTAGGVDTHELSSKTMEATRVPGLYFIGEVVDVTGHLGGFNFQWAWASGFAAGQAI